MLCLFSDKMQATSHHCVFATVLFSRGPILLPYLFGWAEQNRLNSSAKTLYPAPTHLN
jgi:hypothetical protein